MGDYSYEGPGPRGARGCFAAKGFAAGSLKERQSNG